MHRKLAQANLIASPRRRPSAQPLPRPPYPCRAAVNRCPVRASVPFPFNPLWVVGAAALVAVCLTMPLVILKSDQRRHLVLQVDELPRLRLSLLRPHRRDLYFSKLAVAERRQFTDLVSYVEGIVRDNSYPGTDAPGLAFTIVSESMAAGYDPLLVTSVILAESNFRHTVSSSKGAVGLMQIRPATARYISSLYGVRWGGPARLRDPQYNIQLGIAYLKYLEKLFGGNMMHALIAYNWGPTNLYSAIQNRGKKIPGVSVAYSRKILSNHRAWVADLGLDRGGLIAGSVFRG